MGRRGQSAAEQIGQPKPRFLLQGRNENTGQFMPDEQTLEYGQGTLKLLT